MLFRKSHKGKDVKLYAAPFPFDEDIPVNTVESFVVWADGSVVLKTNDLKKAENEYTKRCKVYYDDTHGRFDILKHALIDGVVKNVGEET